MLTVVRRHADLLGPAGVARWEATVYREWAARQLGDGRPAAALPPAWHRLLRQPWSAAGVVDRVQVGRVGGGGRACSAATRERGVRRTPSLALGSRLEAIARST